MISGSDRCWTCGRRRGLAQRRARFCIHPTVHIPRTGNPDDSPAQICNDLICSVSVYRNGGTCENTHLCDDCLRIALRAIKVQVSELLDELDVDHSKNAAIVRLKDRLARLQYKLYAACLEHNRMQERLAALLEHVYDGADPEVVRLAEFEVQRGRLEAGQ